MKILGKLPSGEYLDTLKRSPNYKANGFENLSVTKLQADGVGYGKMFREFFKKHPGTSPATELPFIKSDLQKLKDGELVWFGHSSYIIKLQGKTFLVDPVFSGNASPMSFMVKAFNGSNEYSAADMPSIDYLILTHDHYDHLDYKTLVQLKSKVKSIYCSLGVSVHLLYWGFDKNSITELDWWDEALLGSDIKITATPARHFSGRTFKRAQSLWSSFVLQTSLQQIFLGGDSVYDTHFKMIGDRFKKFDLAILECGQYNTMWPTIHMMPEETVQVALDLHAEKLLPVHWAKFKLAMHVWNEPAERVVAAAQKVHLPILTPKIGEIVKLDNDFSSTAWWRF